MSPKMKSTKAVPVGHLGIILDGNRRWARSKDLPTLEGHRRGAEVFKEVSLAAFDKGVGCVSAYVFSSENWRRTQEEVSYLMGLVTKAVDKYLDEYHQRGIKITVLGSRQKLDSKVVKSIEKATEKTKNNTGGTLALCFNYGGKQEIADAATRLISSGKKNITPQMIEEALYSPEVPPLDLIIRTSGEHRLSGFMLWRSEYAELYFVDKHWPDFTPADLELALQEYGRRQRRFGQ